MLIADDLARIDPMSFADRLTTARKAHGLTQQGLADLAGIHMMQVHRYESGGSLPSLEVLKKLSLALRVSADQLLFGEMELDPDTELRLQFEAVSRLPPAEKQLVIEVVDSLLLKHDAKRWIRPSPQAASG